MIGANALAIGCKKCKFPSSTMQRSNTVACACYVDLFNQTRNPMKKLLPIMLLFASSLALGQQGPRNQNDALFPAQGKFSAGVMTTYGGIHPPPIVVADVTYGVGNKFSIGFAGGTTGAQGLYALKFGGKLLQQKRFGVNLRAMSIYYPSRDGKFLLDRSSRRIIPWMASLATLEGEWRTEKNVRWAAGVGALETHCMIRMKQWLHGGYEETVMPIDLFTTVNVSVSIPLSARLTIRPEVIAVFTSAGLISQGEFMVSSPVNPFINLVYNFR